MSLSINAEAPDLRAQAGQSPPPPPQPTVLIVGAGPAGLFAACELLRHGVRPRIVDQRLTPHHEARGTALQPAVLATLEKAGLAAQFLDAGVHIREIQLLGPGLREIAREHFADAGGPYPFQCSLPQWRTEAMLRAHLSGLGVDVEHGTEVAAIEDDPAGLKVTLNGPAGEEVVTASHLLGAGGAHSVTRHSMQEHLEGATYAGHYFVADARIGLPGPPECGRLIVGGTGLVLLSPLPDERWLVFVTRDDADSSERPPTEAELAALLDTRAGAEVGLHDLAWVSPFRMHKRLVRHFGDGRRFLIGDAAHLSSPLGGEGLNSALMDAADIAWKLALVLRGRANPSLLDSFAIERGLADRHVLEVSDEVHAFAMGLVAACDAGGFPCIPELQPEEHLASLRKRLMLDVSYAGSPLIGPADDPQAAILPGTRFPWFHHLAGTGHHLVTFGDAPEIERLRAAWGDLLAIVDAAGTAFAAEKLGIQGNAAILVRPDGFVGFCAAPADATSMAALHAHLALYLVAETAPQARESAGASGG